MKQIFEGDVIVTHMMRKRFRILDQGSTCKKNRQAAIPSSALFSLTHFFICIIFSPQPLSFLLTKKIGSPANQHLHQIFG